MEKEGICVLGSAWRGMRNKQAGRTRIHGTPRAIAATPRRSQNPQEADGKKTMYVKKQNSKAAPNTPTWPRCLAASLSHSVCAYWFRTMPPAAKIQTTKLPSAIQGQASGNTCRPAAEVSMATGAPRASPYTTSLLPISFSCSFLP